MKKLQQGKKKLQQGFTLIELMIVVAVIGVLAAIAIPQYQNYVKKAALGSALATATALKTNVEDYIAITGDFPAVTATSAGVTASGKGNGTDVSIPSFTLGTIALTASTSSAGNIIVNITNGPAQNANITLKRSDLGNWTCSNSISSAISLNGC